MLRIGRPVKSIGRVCGFASASSARVSFRRSISVSPTTPHTMFPWSVKQRPPNIFRSASAGSGPITSRMRAASVSS